MLSVNEKRSGHIGGIGAPKMKVVLESEVRNELESAQARQMALQVGDQHGFGNAGLSENPVVMPVDAKTGEDLAENDALDPTAQISNYRAEFVLSKRI